MKLINIGFGNMVNADRVIGIVSPDSAPIKRMVQDAREKGALIDASYGRRTQAVLIMDSDHIILSGIPEFSGDFIAVRGACAVAFTGESDTPREVVDLLQAEIERLRTEGIEPEVFTLVKNQVYGGLLGDVEAIDDAAEEAAAAYLKGRTLADEIAALAALTVDDANELLRTALREENRAYVQIDPAE